MFNVISLGRLFQPTGEIKTMERQRYDDFGKRLKTIMEDRELSQLATSRATGISQQSISGWVRGIHIPRGRKLKALADFLEIAPRELCPEAFDREVVSLAAANIQFSPIKGQAGWYMITCKMPVDKEMLDDVLAANDRFEARREEEGFHDVSL